MNTWALTELGIGTGWNCWASLPLSTGDLTVSATLNNSVSMVDPQTMTITGTITGVAPYPEWMAEHGGNLYVACGGWGSGNSVVVIDAATGSVTDTLTAGTNCQSLVAADDGRLFVTCSGTYGNDEGSVVIIDGSTGSTIAVLEVGGFPSWCVSAGDIFYTADPWGGGVFSIDMTSLEVLHSSSNPFCAGGNGLAADDQGNLWVSDTVAGEVRVYDPAGNLIHTYAVSVPGPLAVSGSFSGIHYSGNGTAGVIRVSPNPASSSISVTGVPAGERVTVYDTAGRKVTEGFEANGSAELTVGHLPQGLYNVLCGSSRTRFAVTAR
jgi:DNA-binding beta-propeller fold protein YncE